MRLKQSVFGLAMACLLALEGCIGSEEDGYPALDRKKAIGCWVQNPGRNAAECAEFCLSATGAEYMKFVYTPGPDGKIRFAELFGTYVLSGDNVMTGSHLSRNNVDNRSDSSRSEGSYTIIRDTLNAISPNGVLDPYAHRDTVNNCGPHWQLFPRPADWELP
ncbi:MAG: hypothetical protein JWP91_2577 [Fibrobacteres bacterium]|nr:hypothetical protein [Fibrobacterota bacterium]